MDHFCKNILITYEFCTFSVKILNTFEKYLFLRNYCIGENMCKTGANARQLERKMMCLLKIFNFFRENGKKDVVFAKMEMLGRITQKFRKNIRHFVFSPKYTNFRIFAKMGKSIYVSILCALNFYAK